MQQCSGVTSASQVQKPGSQITKPDSRERQCGFTTEEKQVECSGASTKTSSLVNQPFTLLGISIISIPLSLSIDEEVECFGTKNKQKKQFVTLSFQPHREVAMKRMLAA